LAREAILSAWNQNPRPLEILIGDDSSDDQTQQIAEELSAAGLPIRYLRNIPALGQSRNVQDLFARAAGDVVSLMHDDDRYCDGAFGHLIKPLEDGAGVLAVFGKQRIISEDGAVDVQSSAVLNRSYGRVAERAGLIADSFTAGACAMFPNNGYFVLRSAVEKINYHDHGKASTACDWYFGFRLGQLGRPFFFVDEETADYRLTEDSIDRGGSDATFNVVKILANFMMDQPVGEDIQEFLRTKMNGAIAEAARTDRAQGWRWFFSRWHRGSIVSLGGLKRLLLLCQILRTK
jgi:glycosyltransferase involved in cell wall biosynthesis